VKALAAELEVEVEVEVVIARQVEVAAGACHARSLPGGAADRSQEAQVHLPAPQRRRDRIGT